jgi:hypothetical protein
MKSGKLEEPSCVGVEEMQRDANSHLHTSLFYSCPLGKIPYASLVKASLKYIVT